MKELSRGLKAAVRKLDQDKCVLCHTYGTVGQRNHVSVHHLDYMSYLEPSVKNCVCLCESCHGKVTTNVASPLAWCLRLIAEVRVQYVSEFSDLGRVSQDSNRSK